MLQALGCALLVTALACSTLFAQEPPQDGLALWLDAADAATLQLGANGRIAVWRDRSPAGNDAVAQDGRGPLPVAAALNGQTVLRMSGEGGLTTSKPLAEDAGGLTAFVVYQRGADQASERIWQRLLSSWDPATENDTKRPSYLLGAPRTGEPLEPALAMDLQASIYRGVFAIGMSGKSGNQFLGDIGEVLVYDHAFLAHDQIHSVKNYLLPKWGIVEDTQTDWTLVGPLPDPPERVTDGLPLSDQTDEGGWTRWEPMWDEVRGRRAGRAQVVGSQPHLVWPGALAIRPGERESARWGTRDRDEHRRDAPA